MKNGPLTNFTNGGEGTSGYKHSKEAKLKIGIASKGRIPYMKGKKHSEETKKKIGEYNKGKKLTEEQIYFLKTSRLGSGNPMYGKTQSEETCNKRRESMIGKNSKKVLQYNIEGEFLKEWISASEASKELNIPPSTINAVCRGERNHSGGFLWMFKNKKVKQNIIVNNKKLDYKRNIIQKSLDGGIIKIWENAKVAAKHLRLNSQTIIECCRDNKNSYKDFTWRFTDDLVFLPK